MMMGASYAPLAAQENDTIIVTGKTIAQTLADLNKCLDSNCPPNEDIDASLAHAENLFVDGQYKDAHQIIRKSIKRNRQYARDFPEPVADLYRSSGRVSDHLGEVRDEKFSVRLMRNILENNLPDSGEGKAKILGAELEVGDNRFKQGYPDEALRKYKKIYSEALEADAPVVAGFAKMRELSIYTWRVSQNPTQYRVNRAKREINEYVANALESDIIFRLTAQILLLRLQNSLDEEVSADRLLAEFAALPDTGRPQLIDSKPIRLGSAQGRQRNDNLRGVSVESFEDRWADIGFWVNENGRAENIEILRLEGSDSWVPYVTSSISSRLYAPARRDGENKGTYIVERFTLTSKFPDEITRGIRERDGIPIIRKLDLTVYDDES